MFVCCECCLLSGRGLCDELITRPEESYRLWCVVMCDLETSRMRRRWTGAPQKKKISHILLRVLLHHHCYTTIVNSAAAIFGFLPNNFHIFSLSYPVTSNKSSFWHILCSHLRLIAFSNIVFISVSFVKVDTCRSYCYFWSPYYMYLRTVTKIASLFGQSSWWDNWQLS